MNASAVTPTAEQCSNGTGITAEYNTTVEFGVPSVAYNVTPVDPNASSGAPSRSASGTGAPTSDATLVMGVNTAFFGIVIVCLLVGLLQ